MLKKADIQKIASLLKIDAAKFEEAISAKEEKDLTIDEKLQLFTEADLTARDRNKYQDGKKAGEEMLLKEMKRKHSLEVEGDDPDKIVEALVAKAKKEAGGSVDEKVAELEKKVQHWQTKHKEAEQLAETIKKQKAEADFDRELLAHFPKERDSKFNDDEYLTLVKKTLGVVEKDGKRVFVKDGKELRSDKNFEPLATKDVIESYFAERNWITKDDGGAGGRSGPGGGNSKPGEGGNKFSKMSEVRQYLEEQKIDPKGEKGQAFIQSVTKDNKDFDFNG